MTLRICRDSGARFNLDSVYPRRPRRHRSNHSGQRDGRARLLAFQGSVAVGSVFWGAIAAVAGARVSLLSAGAMLLVSVAARFVFPLVAREPST